MRVLKVSYNGVTIHGARINHEPVLWVAVQISKALGSITSNPVASAMGRAGCTVVAHPDRDQRLALGVAPQAGGGRGLVMVSTNTVRAYAGRCSSYYRTYATSIANLLAEADATQIPKPLEAVDVPSGADSLDDAAVIVVGAAELDYAALTVENNHLRTLLVEAEEVIDNLHTILGVWDCWYKERPYRCGALQTENVVWKNQIEIHAPPASVVTVT